VLRVALSPDLLTWLPYSNGGHVYERSEWARPYEHLHHADQLVGSNGTEFHRIDAITTLKRAVDLRLRWLNTLYGFKSIPLQTKLSGMLEICQRFGILRPLMVDKLQNIRNRVEHQDSPPPSRGECAEFVEFVWYFLRSTDALARMVSDGFVIDPHGGFYDSPYGVTIHTGPKHKWGMNISGWVPGQWITDQPQDGWMLVDCEELCQARELRTKKPGAIARLRKNTGDDTWIIGQFLVPNPHGETIIERYFQAD
jgi:hypothetical protein